MESTSYQIEAPLEIKEILKKKEKKGRRAEKALQTYFRNSYRTHINLSGLADRKSNIMVRLNSLLISILLVFFKSLVSYSPAAVVTGVIFLVTALISLIFAALAARPSVTQNVNEDSNLESLKNNLFFFGNYVHLDYDKYEEAMEAMLESVEDVYGNMIRDLYFLGKVLDTKFKLLRWSYNVFIWGLIVTVISFLFALALK